MDTNNLLSEIDTDFSNVQANTNIDPKEVLSNLDYIGKRMKHMYDLNDMYLTQLNEHSNRLLDCEELLLLIEESKNYYVKAIDLIYEHSIGELEKIINLALQYIFYDTQYKIKIELEDKRGKSLAFYIVDMQGNEIDINDCGRGVRSVVSYVIHVFYLINKGSMPFLFLDEQLSAISTQYVDRFFSFVKSLCKNKDMILVLISHDSRFYNYADKVFEVSQGVVKTVDINDKVLLLNE